MSCSRAEHKTEYLKPLQLFLQTMKRTYYMPSAVFVAFSFRDEYVSVAITDNNCLTADHFGVHTRDETLLDKLVKVVQSATKDRGWDLEGIIVAYDNSVTPPVNIHNLMEVLCKKGNIESLKYTCWKDDIKAENTEFISNKFRSLFGARTLPVENSERREGLERISAKHMLQAFLNVFSTLYRGRDVFHTMRRLKDKEREDEDKERLDKARKMYLDFFNKLNREEDIFNPQNWWKYKESKDEDEESEDEDEEMEDSERGPYINKTST